MFPRTDDPEDLRIWTGRKEGSAGRPGRRLVVYALLDAAGDVLYVGLTGYLGARLRAHRGARSHTRAFIQWVAEEQPSRYAAEGREAQLIDEWRPPLNMAGL